MYFSDSIAILQWWLVLFLLGAAFLPFTMRLFSPFFDKGYLFSRILGASLVAYAVFVLGILHLAPFTVPTISITAILLACILFFLSKQKREFIFYLKKLWLIFAIEELLFITVLFIWAYIHSFNPAIHGLEKFMDFGFVNSILRSKYFPPKDMWFTPYTINYYYFGHLVTAMLTKLSNLPSYITFNLMLSTIVATCFSLTFSLGANLYYHLNGAKVLGKTKLIGSGILTACLVTLAGNLHILYAFFAPYNANHPVPLWQLPFRPFTFPNNYWYPDATRFIYHTIHEFPIYSWTVADLHGHVLDIPFVLITIAFLFALLLTQTSLENEKKIHIGQTFQIPPLSLLIIGFFLAIMYMTNAWDGAIYWLLAMMIILYIQWRRRLLYKKATRWYIAWGRDFFLSLLIITAGLFFFSTPYNFFFDASVYSRGIGVICAPDFLIKIGRIGPFLFEPNHCQRSYWWELLTLYGFFLFFMISFVFFLLRSKKRMITDIFIILLMILATFLIFVPEFFYLKDIYLTYYRANTMFKLVFQAFILLSISSAYVIVRITLDLPYQRIKGKIVTSIFLFITFILVSLVMTYPFLAVNAYYNNFKNYQGLNGIKYLKTLYPDDYAAIKWLNKNIKGQPVILEAQGDSYTDYARISANTGLPTVLGWTVHEWLWRGSYSIPAPRIIDVKTIYETTNLQTAKALLAKYHVRYVYVGTLEFQKYPNLDEQKFAKLGHIVYQHGITRIYKINY